MGSIEGWATPPWVQQEFCLRCVWAPVSVWCQWGLPFVDQERKNPSWGHWGVKLSHAWQLGGVWGFHPPADSPGGSDLELIVATHALCHSVLHLVFPTQPLLGCPGLCWHLVGRQWGGSQGSTLPTTHGQMATGVAGLGLRCPPFPRAGPG